MDIGTLTGQITIEDQLSGALGIATNSIKTFTSELLAMSGLAGPVGAAFAVMGGVIVAAITTITTAIISLGNRGSDVSDVANTFEYFSGSVDVATNSLKEMQEGTKGTVTNFDLMKSASKLLAADVKLTSDQFGTLSKAAFVLQNQGLGGTKEMMDLVSQALLTGRKRSLEMKIGKIDLTKAEQDYRKTLTDSKRALTEMEKAEISRVGIISALNKKVQEAGDQQRDFGETMDSAVVAIKNWGDELSQRVADSPKVMAAVHAIEDAIKKAFGGESQSLIETLVGAIENIADTVAMEGPKVIDWMGKALDKTKEWFGYLERIQKILAFIDPSKFGQALSESAKAGSAAGAGGVKGLLGGALTGAMANSGQYPSSGAGIIEFNPKTTINNPSKKLTEDTDSATAAVKKSTLSLSEWAKGLKDAETSQWKLALSTRKMTLEISDTIKARREELEQVYPPLIAQYGYLTEEMIDQRTGTERLNDSLLKQADILGKKLVKEQEKTHRMIEMATMALAKQRSAWDTTYNSLGHVATILDNVSGKFAEVGVVAARTGQAMMEAFAKQDYIGMAVAGVTGLVTIWKKLTGPTEYEKRVRSAAEEMKTLTAESVKAAGSMQRLALNASMVGINIKGAFDSKDPKFLSQVLSEMETKTQKLNAAMEEYGFTWQDLGDQYRGAALADQFDLLYEKTLLLKGAGINYEEVLSRQAESYSTLVQQAIASQTEIPLAMKPVLEDLLKMGKLTDAGGAAFEDLEDITWAKTLTQGFDQVTTAIYELRDALVNGVGGAIDDLNSRKVHIQTSIDAPDLGARNYEEPAYMAGGGTVVPFRPRGSDTVPAMLTPGERVIPRGGGGGSVVVELNGRRLAEAVVPEIPGAVKRLGIR